jgi:hypothetical protein
LAHSDQAWAGDQAAVVPAQPWFEREAEAMAPTEMTEVSGGYDQNLALLHMPMPAAGRVWTDPVDEDGGQPGGHRRWPCTRG